MYFGISNGLIRFCAAQRASLTLFLCYVYFGAILFAGAKQTPLFFLYIQPGPWLNAAIYIVCFFYLLLAIYWCARLIDRFYLQVKKQKIYVLLLLYSWCCWIYRLNSLERYLRSKKKELTSTQFQSFPNHKLYVPCARRTPAASVELKASLF